MITTIPQKRLFDSVSMVIALRPFLLLKSHLTLSKAADEAMREYMESDDGGSEWLAMMSDLMHEKDEGDMDEHLPGLRP